MQTKLILLFEMTAAAASAVAMRLTRLTRLRNQSCNREKSSSTHGMAQRQSYGK